jgi:hypothetical protein
MASTSSTILDRLQTVFRAINGSAGGYTYTLNDLTDRVMEGAPIEHPNRLQVFIQDAQVRSTGEAPMRMWRRYLTVTVAGFVPSSGNTGGARLKAALDLASDLHKAIEADTTLNGNALHVDIETATLDGAELGIDGMGVCVLAIVAWWTTTGGI